MDRGGERVLEEEEEEEERALETGEREMVHYWREKRGQTINKQR